MVVAMQHQDHKTIKNSWTTRTSDHFKSWQRLGQAHISWPYCPQSPHTTHSTSPSSNLTKTINSPRRSKDPLLLFRWKEKPNTNWTKSSTLDSTTSSSNIVSSAKATHQNTIKSGTPQKTSTMQNTLSNDSSGTTQQSPEWINVMINGLLSAPFSVIKQERHSNRPEDAGQQVARHANPTSPEYSGSPRREVVHASMSWTDSPNHDCQVHLGEKQGSAWYPQFSRKLRQPSVAHDHEWLQEMEVKPGEDVVPQQQPQRRRARRAHHESQAGSLVSMTSATTTDGKRWMPGITPDKWGKKGHCQRTTEGNTRKGGP